MESFDDFLDALLAFESGWDRERYNDGIIQDWQLDTWAGGTVDTFFPQYTSWSQLSDAEWEAMAYRSTNTFGFVGFQFGEALLIDLGYYDDDFYYGNGAALNTWDGTWTGKNGANSLEDFMTAEVQQLAIRDAFGHNLEIIQDGLAAAGQNLDDYIGTTQTYTVGGTPVDIEITMTGLLAAAHLRGAPAVVSLLLYGTLSSDEFGTSILQYIEQFGGFEAPTADALISTWEDGKTGDEGLGGPGEGSGGSGSGTNGTAGVTADTADVVITWTWGQDTVVDDFDPAADTIFIDWFNVGDLTFTETAAGLVIASPGNNQSTTLTGVALADLSPANFTVMDAALGSSIFAMIGDDGSGDGSGDGGSGDGGSGDGSGDGGTGDGGTGDGSGDGGTGDGGTGDGAGDGGTGDGGTGDDLGLGTAGVNAQTATVAVTYNGSQNLVIDDFDPATDTIFVDWYNAAQVEFTATADGLLIEVPHIRQTWLLTGVTLASLTAANFTFNDATAAAEVLALVGDSGTGDGGTGDGGTGDGHGDHGDHGDEAVMHMVTLTSPSMTVDDFDVTKDMVHLEGGITADRLMISEAGGDTTFIISNDAGTVLSTLTLVGIALNDLDLGNFSIAEQSALNEVASAIGQSISVPVPGGKTVVYDSDGSNPPATNGTNADGGTIYVADYFADDIVGFNPATDQIDFGDISVHNMILGKAPSGEVIIDNPWWTDMQIIQGVTLADLTIESFGIVGNEHFRQDIGGVMSWELGIGPREDNTTYIRSHEYGVTEVINGFDPATDMISFLYYGTRERLSVEDTDAGLMISTYPSGQTFIFTGLTLADLNPGNVAFHHDQVVEDKLEEPFGFSANDVTLVSREDLLTPEGPAGQITDGHQTQIGVGAPVTDSGSGDGSGDGGTGDGGIGDGSGDGSGDGGTGDGGTGDGGSGNGGSDGDPADTGNGHGTANVTSNSADVVVTWNWGANTFVDDFDPDADTIFIDWFSEGEVTFTEENGDLIIAIPGNLQTIVLAGVALSDLSPSNFTVMRSDLGESIFAQIGSGDTGGVGDDQGTGDGDTDIGDGMGDGSDGDPSDGSNDGSDSGAGGDDGVNDGDGVVDVFELGWNWGAEEVISGFAADEDILDFGSLPASLVDIKEEDGDLLIEILNNGGHVYVLENVQAEDLGLGNLSAPDWSTVLTANNGVIDQLTALGADELV